MAIGFLPIPPQKYTIYLNVQRKMKKSSRKVWDKSMEVNKRRNKTRYTRARKEQGEPWRYSRKPLFLCSYKHSLIAEFLLASGCIVHLLHDEASYTIGEQWYTDGEPSSIVGVPVFLLSFIEALFRCSSATWLRIRHLWWPPLWQCKDTTFLA